jgi:hypothetical protein
MKHQETCPRFNRDTPDNDWECECSQEWLEKQNHDPGYRPSHEGAILLQDHLKFFLAGKAFFTLRSKKTGTRYTYRIIRATEKDDPTKKLDLWFISFLTGPDNWANYTYIGAVRPQPKPNTYTFSTTKASRLPAEAPPCVAIDYAFNCLAQMNHIPGVEVWHSGRCGRCGRMLTVPESIASGFGPECLGSI